MAWFSFDRVETLRALSDCQLTPFYDGAANFCYPHKRLRQETCRDFLR